MSCSLDNGQTCIKFATSTTIQAGLCTTGHNASLNAVSVTVPADPGVSTTITLFAPLIQLNWQQSDLEVVDSTMTVAAITSSTSIFLSSQMSSSISSGVIIAIAVIVPLTALLLLGMALLCLRRHRKRARRRNRVITISRPISTERHMFRTQMTDNKIRPKLVHEKEGILVRLHEAPDSSPTNELDAASAPKELSARESGMVYELMNSESQGKRSSSASQ